ncbi:hypothetical protein L249_1515 [Ophiocordyceps polyrhachis-furcata BCC 54312]|uniref:Peroxin/Ferlin domain-containing protein n=1 Tax=Ophiocordyceps polyrhachis-furcata BCC 54312 TaxID=1330021 RepID=A0A367L4D1_9HYPO|nr:hypothetical protein L249_1515 [Ophiocordyceps polyrhachis-furcata BCC 54312]
MLKVRSSRRAAGLKPSDYDHEIDLENHDESRPTTHRPSTTSPLIRRNDSEVPEEPSIEIQGNVRPPTPQPQLSCVTRETAIDILYENERGGFLCGSALFSAKALGCLDPPAWTNTYHKASPTSIHTAQVPDPSWEWTWPEWRINHQDGVDEGGWEYSFAFSNKFSWHAAKWWNSFVRRRAWTRKRARPKDEAGDVTGPNMLNTDYFTVRPASHIHRLSNASLGPPSMSQVSEADDAEEEEPLSHAKQPDIHDMDTLLQTLRQARIDREKGEAVDNYIDHAVDLDSLECEMHDIMSLFIFQASRRQLLAHLMRKHDEAAAELTKHPSEPSLRKRKLALDAAVRHAQEEVRRLAFWSDVRQMARDGDARLSLESEQAWHDAAQSPPPAGPTRVRRPGSARPTVDVGDSVRGKEGGSKVVAREAEEVKEEVEEKEKVIFPADVKEGDNSTTTMTTTTTTTTTTTAEKKKKKEKEMTGEGGDVEDTKKGEARRRGGEDGRGGG